ncbi:hypothetical protein H6P81_017139 [Aristolochia fimbriata]|uniref:Uncharacterized protein n=1 Tax=Aristolochia fimbriata TaxID=158543 RepID=A0AAV7DXB5_ARIFI|nr:hypothetical protein H6P81_017139 [Aristolochia fimbriata]
MATLVQQTGVGHCSKPLKVAKPCQNPSVSFGRISLIGNPSRRWRYSLKCSSEYNGFEGDFYHKRVVYPRPAEVPWKKELCNSVQLIGVIATPVQIKQLSSGKVVAWTRLAVRRSATETAWINLTLWEDLAHVAFQHLEKGNQVYVSGRLVSDTVEGEDEKRQTYYKVVVQQLNFVEKTFPASTSPYDMEKSFPAAGIKKSNWNNNQEESIEKLWQAFFANPMDWWDNRKNKRNPKYPDFKHKDTQEALWVDASRILLRSLMLLLNYAIILPFHSRPFLFPLTVID